MYLSNGTVAFRTCNQQKAGEVSCSSASNLGLAMATGKWYLPMAFVHFEFSFNRQRSCIESFVFTVGSIGITFIFLAVGAGFAVCVILAIRKCAPKRGIVASETANDSDLEAEYDTVAPMSAAPSVNPVAPAGWQSSSEANEVIAGSQRPQGVANQQKHSKLSLAPSSP